MPGFESWGKILILVGVIITVIGVGLMFWHHIPFLGKLPGDIFVQKGNFQFIFPVVTCLVLSAVLTLVVNLILRFLVK